MSAKIAYLMRGLPSSGKSFTARRLAGTDGVVLETDQYFYTEVGDDPTKFEFRRELMDTAREWVFRRFCDAVAAGASPIVVDRGNALCELSARFARYAVEHGYDVQLREPDSDIWQEIRVLLKYKDLTRTVLDQWAERLADINKRTHGVSARSIRRLMDKWRHDVTIEDILKYKAKSKKAKAATE